MKTAARTLLFLMAAVVVLLAGFGWYVTQQRPERPVLVGASPAAGVVVGASGRPSLHAEFVASGITHFQVAGGAGQMEISPSTDGKIHVDLELRQQEKSLLWLYHWLSNDTARDIMSATLQQAKQGDTLVLALVYPSGEDRSDIQERWTIKLPPQLMLDAALYAGELKITGMQGGVKSALTAGETVIQDVSGAVDASVRYGRLHVISASNKPGVLNVTADHGIALMSLDGKYYGPPEKHGFWNDLHLIGNTEAERRPGADNIALEVAYGEADLRVGALGDFKDYHDLFTAD